MRTLTEMQRLLPEEMVRGPFTFRLLRNDGMALVRMNELDGVECAYRESAGDLIRPYLVAEEFMAADRPDEAMAEEAKRKADKTYEYYRAIYERIREHEGE